MSTATLEKSLVDYTTVPSTTTVTAGYTVPTVFIKPLPAPLPRRSRYTYAEQKVAEIEPAEAKAFAELLTAAAERLRTKGWTRGTMGTAAGPNCAVGAIEQIAITPSRERLYSAVMLFNGMQQQYPYGMDVARNSVIAWNDSSASSKRDVIAAFEKTAALLTELSETVAA